MFVTEDSFLLLEFIIFLNYYSDSVFGAIKHPRISILELEICPYTLER